MNQYLSTLAAVIRIELDDLAMLANRGNDDMMSLQVAFLRGMQKSLSIIKGAPEGDIASALSKGIENGIAAAYDRLNQLMKG